MIQITTHDLKNKGGLLATLAVKSAEYVRSITPSSAAVDASTLTNLIRRHIVHTDPHIDEYFAELIFRACVSSSDSTDFIEESLFSPDSDFGAQQLWPEAVVFGIGSTVSYGVRPIFLFDEHVTGKGKTCSSCSEVVAEELRSWGSIELPRSVQTVLNEVNVLDEYGKAHPQSLWNITKTLHQVRFLFSKGASPKDDVRDSLSAIWKRAVVDCCLVSVIYALENGVDLVGDPKAKKDALQRSLEHYAKHSFHRGHPKFEEALQQIGSDYGNQKGTFDQAFLRGAQSKLIVDNSGTAVPQLLLLSRVCFASLTCWGDDITNAVMMHLWETEFQRQINFLTVWDELEIALQTRGNSERRTSVGVIRFGRLPSIEIQKQVVDKSTHQKKLIKGRAPLWILNLSPAADFFSAHKAALNYMNQNNDGCGVVLIDNSYSGTKVLLKGGAISDERWGLLINKLKTLEPACWYDASTDPDRPAPFLNNGNKAHQYVPRSGLDFDALCDLARTTF
jgi:hypothetical protein